MKRIGKIANRVFFYSVNFGTTLDNAKTILFKVTKPLKSCASSDIEIKTFGLRLLKYKGRLRISFLKRYQIIHQVENDRTIQ